MTEDACILRETRPKYYGTLRDASSSSAALTPGAHKCIRYTVQPGDTLSSIAVRHDVSVSLLKRVNRMWSNDVLVTDTLLIPIPPSSSEPLSTSTSSSSARSADNAAVSTATSFPDSSQMGNSRQARHFGGSRPQAGPFQRPLNSAARPPQMSLEELMQPRVATIVSRPSDSSLHSNPLLSELDGSESSNFTLPDEIFHL
ncbi:LysM and putative peptidoglycan-binding domain-containing protein 1 [Sparganum proliferum]